MPVAILIHSGAPHDTKIFTKINGKPPKKGASYPNLITPKKNQKKKFIYFVLDKN